jgi:hypothetical protein
MESRFSKANIKGPAEIIRLYVKEELGINKIVEVLDVRAEHH